MLYHTSLCRSFSQFPSGKYSDKRSARLLQTVRPHTCLQGNPLPPESDNQCRLYCCRYDDGQSDTVPAQKLLRKNQDLTAAFQQWPGLLFPVIFRYSFRIFLHNLLYIFLFTIFVSYLPVSISMKRTNRETLLSSFRLFHSISVKASISSGISTSFGSPWKLGSGLPSCI